ncbi:MAG: phosphatase PAP2 family protein [Haloarculaceae archaeon]
MYRLEGLSAVIRELTPSALTELFAVVTTLGDPVFLVGVVAALYWLVDDQESATRLIGYTLVAIAVTISLKEGLALPRPPADVRAVAVESGSGGFPSGHAIGATVVYGGSVLLFDRLRTPRTAAVVTALVALVSLSRVVIGVHYLGDVVAGVAVGAAILGVVRSVGEPRFVYLLAALAVVPGMVVTGGEVETIFVFGAGVGASAVAFLTC